MRTPLFPPKKLLVPLDLSEAGYAAWDMGLALAHALGAAVEAVHVYETQIRGGELRGPLPHLSGALRTRLEDDMRRRIGKGAVVTVLEGSPGEAILELARGPAGPDMIVMGTHGRRGLTRVLWGSTAEYVARRSPAPVVTLRGRWTPVRSILVPVNFADGSDAGLFAAAGLALRLGARLDVLYVLEEPHDETFLQAAFEEAVKKLPPALAAKPPRLLRGSGSPVRRIVTVGLDYDLIVLVARRKSALVDATLGTTAERVLRESEVPVLSIPVPAPAAAGPRKGAFRARPA